MIIKNTQLDTVLSRANLQKKLQTRTERLHVLFTKNQNKQVCNASNKTS